MSLPNAGVVTYEATQVSSQQGQRHWGIEMLISVIAVAISLAAIFVHYLH